MNTSKTGGDKAPSAYEQAGVDIDEMISGLDAVKRMVRSTRTPGVCHEIGGFGGVFRSPGEDQLLVASTDGVGTKLKVAAMVGRHDTVGQDLVNHCVNDILVMGARPLFFLDYLGTVRLRAEVFTAVISGICKACRENGCALLGGETAEMPGLYPEGEYDLVGTIVGRVERGREVTGAAIEAGDVLLGLPSGGLQTNGFSLARKVLFEQCGLKPDDLLPGTPLSVAEHLLAIHRSFLGPVSALLQQVEVRGMAHITGGGFVDNIPRILPEGLNACIERRAWSVPAIFDFIGEKGAVARHEMYRVFNMGIGFVVIVAAAQAGRAVKVLKSAGENPAILGRIVPGSRKVVFEDG